MYYDQSRMRFELLRALYIHDKKHPEAVFSEADIESEFDVSPIQLDLVVDWLQSNGYIQTTAPDSHLAITAKGVDEIDARTAYWRREIDEIVQWLAHEKERIATECEAQGLSAQGISRVEISRKKEAIVEARRRRQALEARMRDLKEPMGADE